MNFLALCQQVRAKAGIAGTGPASVDNQTGMNALIVGWVQQAWLEIQGEHTDWSFLCLEDQSQNLSTGIHRYSGSALGVGTVDRWRRMLFRLRDDREAVADEGFLPFIDWRDLKTKFVGDVQTGRPTCVSVTPKQEVVVHPIPDVDNYVLKFDCFTQPVTLTAGTDVPAIPEHLQWAIIHKAVTHFAAYEDAPEIYAEHKGRYDTVFAKLERYALPELHFDFPALDES